jgi:VWFA-related protein
MEGEIFRVKKITHTGLFILFLLLFLYLPAQERLQYKVTVENVLVPLFVVDRSGTPVFDLTKEDLTVFVNGQPVEISHFFRYQFQYDREIKEKNIEIKKPLPEMKRETERVFFIVIDRLYNSSTGLRRSKKIAVNLIRKGTLGDRFIIIENSLGRGLKYIGGPEESQNELITKVRKISTMSRWGRNPHSTRDLTNIEGGSGYRAISPIRGKSAKLEYKNMVKHFSHTLAQLKYALKTITRPKVVFLISEGIAEALFRSTEERGETVVFLKKFIKAINQGGSVLYTINPQAIEKSIDQRASGETSLSYLASESGGKYFAGSNIEKIVKRIKRTTAAYYEISLNFKPKANEKLKLDVKCRRPDVRVHTLVQFEANKPYHRMKLVEKKLFAFNVVTGGSWSRMVGHVEKVKARNIKKEKSSAGKKYTFDVDIPDFFQKDKIEAFSIRFDPKSQALDIQVNTHDLRGKNRLQFTIKGNRKENLYIVFIEPTAPDCIFVELK